MVTYTEVLRGTVKPTEEQLLEAVTNYPYMLKAMFAQNIVPSESVQMAAVKQQGTLIRYILRMGIRPSDTVIRTAVKNNPQAVNYLKKVGIHIRWVTTEHSQWQFRSCRTPQT